MFWIWWVAEDPMFHHADSEDSDQTGRMPRLIWVFAGRTCHFVGFVMRRLMSRVVKPKPKYGLYYTPSIYAKGYIVFVFPFVCSSVRIFVRLFVRNFVPFVELLQTFTLKQLKWSISHQPLIRKHSYLDHRFPGGSAFIPWLLTPGSIPRGGARDQNLGHL